jgi:NTE family protein
MKQKQKNHQAEMGEKTVLVLQGGGALGAYQAGVFEELDESGHSPDWVAGISIGAINAALIVGNPPERRVQHLRAFWDKVSSQLTAKPVFPGDMARAFFNQASASFAALSGVPGFFKPRFPPATTALPGTPGALSHYETDPLRKTLEELVDFDLINTGKTRLSIGAVNIRTGNFAYFDNHRQVIGPQHIMASGALPPGFAPVEIDGEFYWDGGLVSNTPLQYVLDEVPRPDMLIFQADLFSARGPMPRNILDVSERDKDIRYSSRTRLNTDIFRHDQTVRRAAHRLLSRLPGKLKDNADAAVLHAFCCNAAVTIVHLIHRRKSYSTQSKDYEFSRVSIDEHWQRGLSDMRKTFDHKAWKTRKKPKTGVQVFDLAGENGQQPKART